MVGWAPSCGSAGRRLADFQSVDFLQVDKLLREAELLALRVGRLEDEGRLEHVMVSMIERRARDLRGANGIAEDSRATRHLMLLGEHATGLPAI